ncbi:hypothetical protein M3701_09480 [Corynebacterium mucifaciens]|nr:hypothetical protein [Corynebacterium mucifaciens]
MTETSWVAASEQPRDDVPSVAPAPAEESTDDAAGEPAAEPAIGALSLDPAHQGQIGGECGTTPEGATISVGDSTSCDFAAVVYPHAIGAEYAWSNKPGVTSVPFTELYGVVSPATGGAYDLHCDIGSAGDTLSCTGPDNDPYMSYGFDPGRTWHPLINIVGDYPS